MTLFLIKTKNFDERSAEVNTDRYVGSAYWAQLSVVAVNKSSVQLLRRTYTPCYVPYLHADSLPYMKENV